MGPDSLFVSPIDMLLSAVSVLVVAQSSSEIPEGLMNNPVFLVWLIINVIIIIIIIHYELGLDRPVGARLIASTKVFQVIYVHLV